MKTTARIKKNYHLIKFQKLVIVSILIGFLSAFLGISLKKMTEHYEEIFFHQANVNPYFYILFPVFGLSVIYFLREYLFKKKENKVLSNIDLWVCMDFLKTICFFFSTQTQNNMYKHKSLLFLREHF